MFIRISRKLRRAQWWIFFTFKIKIFQNDCFLNTSNYIFYHSWTFSHFLFDIYETFYSSSTVIDEVVDSQTTEIFALMSLLYNLV